MTVQLPHHYCKTHSMPHSPSAPPLEAVRLTSPVLSALRGVTWPYTCPCYHHSCGGALALVQIVFPRQLRLRAVCNSVALVVILCCLGSCLLTSIISSSLSILSCCSTSVGSTSSSFVDVPFWFSISFVFLFSGCCCLLVAV